LEKAWKSLEILGKPWKTLLAKRRRGASFLDPMGAL
jgi:hypothetical protein